MADVRLSIAAREYIVTCRDGEEDRLNALGRMVDSKVREAGGTAGGLNESRQLLFAALLLADQLQDSNAAASPSPSAATPNAITPEMAAQMADSLERLAIRLESLAAGLEQ